MRLAGAGAGAGTAAGAAAGAEVKESDADSDAGYSGSEILKLTKPLEILVVSDATGATAEAVVRSTLVQFGRASARVRRFPFTRSVDQLRTIFDDVDPGEAIVVFTFVSRELSESVVDLGRQRGLVVLDLLGPLMNIFSDALQSMPSRTPGAFRGQSEDMFKVIEAIHFTRRHDDGQGLESFDEADLIILGVSRTGKTPTSIFLSCRKLKVANVPIINEVPRPEEVRLATAPKVGFTMDLDRQIQVRTERAGRMGTRIPGYSDRSHIMREIDYCSRIYRSITGIRIVDVTNRSIEETSDWITHHVL